MGKQILFETQVFRGGAEFVGDEGRLDFSNMTPVAANTDGGMWKMGTDAARVISDTADMKFLAAYFDNGATSGDNRGFYLRLYLTGAGGGGEALRAYTDCENVACGTAHGAHISLGFGATGSITGLGVAGRNTLHIPNAAMTGGTYAALQAEVFSDGASSDPTGVTQAAMFRAVNDGNATGKGKVDDKFDLFELAGFTSGSGNLLFNSTLRLDVGGDTRYLILSQTEDELAMIGDSRINLSACTVKAANTDGGLFKAGTDAARVVEDTADMKFMAAYLDNGATSGDNRGFYLRLYLTGAGGGGEALRAYTDCENVACSTAHGAHLSLGFGATGSITGLGVAGRNTLHVPNAALTGGTYAALQAEAWADGASSDVSGATSYALIRAGIGGDASGMATIDTAGYLLDLFGMTPDSGKLIGNAGNEPTWTGKTRLCRVRLPDGSLTNLLLVDP